MDLDSDVFGESGHFSVYSYSNSSYTMYDLFPQQV